MFEGIRYLFAGMPTRSFDILYNMHSFASFLRSARDLQPNDWSILVTLDVLWWRCKTYRAARRCIISSLFICVAAYYCIYFNNSMLNRREENCGFGAI